MRILGLDPGTATTGFGIIDAEAGRMQLVDYGVITTPAGDDPAERLRSIFDQVTELLHTHQPDTSGVEKLFFGRNITTAIRVGEARGVLLLALAHAGIPIGEYSPPQIKESVTGYGKADKAQMQLMVRQLLGLTETPRPDDAADALAVAITHYHYYQFQSLVDAE